MQHGRTKLFDDRVYGTTHIIEEAAPHKIGPTFTFDDTGLY